MEHRHLISDGVYSCAAIDDVIGRGSRADWAELRLAADADHSLLAKILRVCGPKVSDPYEQRYHFWKYHAEHALA